jgi:hypothetical protein
VDTSRSIGLEEGSIQILGLGLLDRAPRLPVVVGLGLLGGTTTLSSRVAKEVLVVVGRAETDMRRVLNRAVSKYQDQGRSP